MAESNDRKVGSIAYTLPGNPNEDAQIATPAPAALDTPELVKEAESNIVCYLRSRIKLNAKLAENERVKQVILKNMDEAAAKIRREIQGLDYVFTPISLAVCMKSGKGATKKFSTPFGSISLNSQSSVSVTNKAVAIAVLKEDFEGKHIAIETVPETTVEKIDIKSMDEETRAKLKGKPGFNVKLPLTEVSVKE